LYFGVLLLHHRLPQALDPDSEPKVSRPKYPRAGVTHDALEFVAHTVFQVVSECAVAAEIMVKSKIDKGQREAQRAHRISRTYVIGFINGIFDLHRARDEVLGFAQ
jgi:hypothetical protein